MTGTNLAHTVAHGVDSHGKLKLTHESHSEPRPVAPKIVEEVVEKTEVVAEPTPVVTETPVETSESDVVETTEQTDEKSEKTDKPKRGRKASAPETTVTEEKA